MENLEGLDGLEGLDLNSCSSSLYPGKSSILIALLEFREFESENLTSFLNLSL